MSHLDRTGAPPEDQPTEEPTCVCDGSGWIDPDADHPRPCYACRPHLLPAARRRHLYSDGDPGPSGGTP